MRFSRLHPPRFVLCNEGCMEGNFARGIAVERSVFVKGSFANGYPVVKK